MSNNYYVLLYISIFTDNLAKEMTFRAPEGSAVWAKLEGYEYWPAIVCAFLSISVLFFLLGKCR